MACRVCTAAVRSLAKPRAWAKSLAGEAGFQRVTRPPGPGNLSAPLCLGWGASSTGRVARGSLPSYPFLNFPCPVLT